jgi:hypothetical protein
MSIPAFLFPQIALLSNARFDLSSFTFNTPVGMNCYRPSKLLPINFTNHTEEDDSSGRRRGIERRSIYHLAREYPARDIN